MSTFDLKDKTAISGVGNTEYGRPLNRSAVDLAAEALENACEDAGIGAHDVDGLIMSVGSPLGVDCDSLAQMLGLNLRMYSQTWTHGRFTATCIQQAAMYVAAGFADTVACMASLGSSGVQAGLNPRPFNTDPFAAAAARDEAAREGGGGHGQDPVYGIDTTDVGAALVARVYFDRYGATSEQLAAVSIATRRHAAMNSGAMNREPLSLDDYMQSPLLATPLREPDYSLVAEGAACVIVTSTERARDMRKTPVLISGMQPLPVGREEFIWTYPGFGVAQQERRAYGEELQPVYKMAGVDHSAIDALFTYDVYSIITWMALERWGFCKPGEAADFTQGGRIEIDGELPINSHGGLLSEAHMFGWNAQVEIVRQMRRECGERQLGNTEIVQWANAYGDSLIYRR